MCVKEIGLSKLTPVQMRESTDEATIKQYAEMFEAVDIGEWPFNDNCVVFSNGEVIWIADGIHRYEAAKRANRMLVCEVHQGGREDAEDWALAANKEHGRRRTREDIRHAIKCALKMERWAKKSNRMIADHIGTTHVTVASVRGELESVGKIIQQDFMETKDGKKRNRRKQGNAEAQETPDSEINETVSAPPIEPKRNEPEEPPSHVVEFARIYGELKRLLPDCSKSEADDFQALLESFFPSIKPKPSKVASASVEAIFDHYRTYRPMARPSDKMGKLVKARLKEGYSVGDLKAAIDGNYKDPHCCGDNERNTEYHDLSLIFRDSDKVARFIEVAQKPAANKRMSVKEMLEAAG